jgi:hypothetical protein
MALNKINLHLTDFREREREIIENLIIAYLQDQGFDPDEIAWNIEVLTFTSPMKGY